MLGIQNDIISLNTNKATTDNNIRPKILGQNVETTANTLQLLFKNALSNSKFPKNLKLADITPVLKKKDTYLLTFNLQFQKISKD